VMDSSKAIPQANAATHRAPSLRRPALTWLVATVVLLLCMLLVLQDLASSNRPHELQNAPWVAALTLLNLVPCVGVFRGLARYARAHGGGSKPKPGFYALVLGLVIVASLNALILVGAAGTIPAVLGD